MFFCRQSTPFSLSKQKIYKKSAQKKNATEKIAAFFSLIVYGLTNNPRYCGHISIRRAKRTVTTITAKLAQASSLQARRSRRARRRSSGVAVSTTGWKAGPSSKAHWPPWGWRARLSCWAREWQRRSSSRSMMFPERWIVLWCMAFMGVPSIFLKIG